MRAQSKPITKVHSANPDYNHMTTETIFVIWLCFGIVTAIAAQQKNKSFILWFILGVLLGPFGLIAALLQSPYSPKTHMICPDCGEYVLLSARVCKHCGCRFKVDDKPKQPN